MLMYVLYFVNLALSDLGMSTVTHHEAIEFGDRLKAAVGDYILYLHQGHKEWEGSNKDIIYCKNELLNNFIFASEFLQDAKTQRMLEDKK